MVYQPINSNSSDVTFSSELKFTISSHLLHGFYTCSLVFLKNQVKNESIVFRNIGLLYLIWFDKLEKNLNFKI